MIFDEPRLRRKWILDLLIKSVDSHLEMLENEDLVTASEWEHIWRLRDCLDEILCRHEARGAVICED